MPPAEGHQLCSQADLVYLLLQGRGGHLSLTRFADESSIAKGTLDFLWRRKPLEKRPVLILQTTDWRFAAYGCGHIRQAGYGLGKQLEGDGLWDKG